MKKFLIAILSLFMVALALPLQAEPGTEKSLYERLGGVFAIAAVVDHFSDAVVQNPRGEGLEEPSPQGVAHKELRQVAGSQVHAHPVGRRGHGRAIQILGNQAGQDSFGPREGAS